MDTTTLAIAAMVSQNACLAYALVDSSSSESEVEDTTESKRSSAYGKWRGMRSGKANAMAAMEDDIQDLTNLYGIKMGKPEDSVLARLIREGNDAQYRTFFGFARAEFRVLLDLALPHILKPRNRHHNEDPEVVQNRKAQLKKRKLLPELEFGLTMIRLRKAIDFDIISLLTNVKSTGSLNHIFWHTIDCLNLALHHCMRWPDVARRQQYRHIINSKFPMFTNCVGMVDCSPFKIARPSKKKRKQAPLQVRQRYFYNGYKKCHDIKVFAVCGPDGDFIWLSCGVAGSKNDATIWQESTLRIMSDVYFQPGEYLAADEGFGIDDNILRPFAEPKGQEDLFNKGLARARVGIEWGFGHLKVLWPLLTKVSCGSKYYNINMLIMACARLSNFANMNYGSSMSSYFSQ
eukprot:GILK01005583.1.p1 GENE.GILK01005583.1~~GILK01005583.1.p1  ORF type:complete len:418 (+),score=39.57 GILK01005583.1:45-1256(+)